MKSFAAHAVRHLVRAQAQLMGVSIDLSNQIRSGLKIFGLVAGKGEGRAPAFRVRELLDGRPALAAIIDPLLAAWRVVREQIAVLDRRLIKIAHSSTQSRTMHHQITGSNIQRASGARNTDRISPITVRAFVIIAAERPTHSHVRCRAILRLYRWKAAQISPDLPECSPMRLLAQRAASKHAQLAYSF